MMNTVEDLIAKLHPIERKIISFLSDGKTDSEIEKESGVSSIEVTRGIQWLENKDVLKIESTSEDIVEIAENGKNYLKNGLPEIRYLKLIEHGAMTIKELQESKLITAEETAVCTGILKGKAAIDMKEGTVFITEHGKKLLVSEPLELSFLKRLENNPVSFSDIVDEDKYSYDNLIKRKNIIKKITVKTKSIFLTDLGKKLVKEDISKIEVIDTITPNVLKEGSWKGKTFRSYDIKINVPKIKAGKRHPYSEFVEKVRQKVIEMGFKEEYGPIIEMEFYNFDSLFQPQTHPARIGNDTYHIKTPKYGRLPDKKIVDAIRNAHENGASTGSTGWGYKWDEKMASRLMPRSHDTAISPRSMSHGVKIPGRYFSLVRCYRPDVIDAKHGVEFNQLGGFIVGEDLNFRHLLGILKDFVTDMTGIEEVRFMPDYFPFTEPSVQIAVKHPQFGWMELAGAGVFRPELTKPLGINEPVIAWGFGIDRLAMLKLGVNDIRDLFSQDIEYLRNTKRVQL
jgi:phenylalanyl-tRNA synthetase alpha chain